MKNVTRFFFLGLFATLVLQFPPAIVHADICALCEARPHVCSPETLAACKNPCSKEDQEKIKGLIGRLKALKEVADLTRKEYNKAGQARDKGRDSIWGADGALAKFSNSLLGLATSAQGGAGKWKAIREASGWASTGYDVAFNRDEGTTWAGLGTGVTGKVVNTKTAEDVYYAAGKAADFYRVTGEARISAKVFYDYSKRYRFTPVDMGSLKKSVEFAGVAVAAYDFYNDTDALATGLSEYFEARRESRQLQAQLDRIDQQIEEILKELEALRKRCASKEAPSEASGSSLTGSSESHKGLTGASTLSMSIKEDRPDDAALQKVLALQTQLDRIDAKLQDRIFIPLSPFMTDAWKVMQPKLLWEIVQGAVPDLKVLPEDLDRAIDLGREAESALR